MRLCQNGTKGFVYFTIVIVHLLVISHIKATEQSLKAGLVIDSAYLKQIQTKRHPEFFGADEGTIHVFLSNLGSQAVGIQDGFINEIPLSDQKVFLWRRISPNPIPPMESGELVVRLRKPIVGLSQSKDTKLRFLTTKGEELSASIPLVNHPFHFTFIGFSDALDTIYLYMKNSGQRSLSIDKVFLSIKDVTLKCRIPEHDIPPNEKKLAVIKLDEPLIRGEYITVKVSTKGGIIAQSRVRAFSDFPIGYDPDGSDIELFMDEAGYKWSDNKRNSSFAYLLKSCP
jgi:hypothetical protein